MTFEQVERHDIDQLCDPLARCEHIGCEAGRRIPLARAPADVALGVDKLGAIGQEPYAIIDQAPVGIGDVRPAAPGPVATKQRVHDRFGRVEPDLGLPVMLQAGKGVEEQQGLVRGPPAAAGELADAVEPGEQGLAVERYRGRWSIEG